VRIFRIRQWYWPRLTELRKRLAGEKDQARRKGIAAEIASLQAEEAPKLEAVLTEAQRAKLKALWEEGKKGRSVITTDGT
jgi:hypothetical protein